MSSDIIKVHGSFNSAATLKVLACLFEHDLQVQFVHVDLDAGGNKTKPFLRISPFGEVPVYEDNGIINFESRAIIRSVSFANAKKLGQDALIYHDSRKQAVVSNWVDVEDQHFEPPALVLISELITKPMKGLDPDQAVVVEAEAKLAEVLDVYESQLAKSVYLVADKYTIVDVLHLPNLHNLMSLPVGKRLIGSRPRVYEWCTNILARPAWLKVVDMQNKAQS